MIKPLSVTTIKSKRAVKFFRKVLRAKLRSGLATLRVFGSRGNWTLGVQVGGTVHIYSTNHITMTTAIMAGYRKFRMKATQYKGRALAA